MAAKFKPFGKFVKARGSNSWASSLKGHAKNWIANKNMTMYRVFINEVNDVKMDV